MMAKGKDLDKLLEEALEDAPKIEGFTIKELVEITEEFWSVCPHCGQSIRGELIQKGMTMCDEFLYDFLYNHLLVFENTGLTPEEYVKKLTDTKLDGVK